MLTLSELFTRVWARVISQSPSSFRHVFIGSSLSSLFSRALYLFRAIVLRCPNLFSVFWHITRRFLTKIWQIFDWLLLPKDIFHLACRHTIALALLFTTQIAIKLFVVPACRRVLGMIRPLLESGQYLHAELALEQRLLAAQSYIEWKKAASDLDRLQGRYAWKENSKSPYYDWRRIRDDLCTLRQLVDSKDIKGIMTFSRSRLLRNLVGINDRRLYLHLRAGTKRLIEEYLSEVVRGLQLVCVVDDSVSPISNADKLSFFNETRHAFGRSALLLSGGATLGLYHLGVIKALFDNQLLPRVLSGSSVGSIINAIIGTRTDEELKELFIPDSYALKLNFFPPNGGSMKRKIKRLFSQGVLMDISILKRCVKANVPNLTFQEAYDRTGRIINIVVSPAKGSGNQDGPRLLNYLTAPNVLVWSAALASCAIPGVYAPVELLAKDEEGRIHKYLEGQVKWEDGSVQADLPMQRLSELFNINHFIVSQVNPHVAPFLSSESTTHHPHQSFLSNPLSKLIEYLSSEIRCAILHTYRLELVPLHPSAKAILDQKYVGDITIVPDVTLSDYPQLLVNPTAERLKACIQASEYSTWKLIPVIRGACEIEFTLDECVRRMRGMIIMEELQVPVCGSSAHHSRLSRVRSWSTDLLAAAPMRCTDESEQGLEDERREADHTTWKEDKTVIPARRGSGELRIGRKGRNGYVGGQSSYRAPVQQLSSYDHWYHPSEGDDVGAGYEEDEEEEEEEEEQEEEVPTVLAPQQAVPDSDGHVPSPPAPPSNNVSSSTAVTDSDTLPNKSSLVNAAVCLPQPHLSRSRTQIEPTSSHPARPSHPIPSHLSRKRIAQSAAARASSSTDSSPHLPTRRSKLKMSDIHPLLTPNILSTYNPHRYHINNAPSAVSDAIHASNDVQSQSISPNQQEQPPPSMVADGTHHVQVQPNCDSTVSPGCPIFPESVSSILPDDINTSYPRIRQMTKTLGSNSSLHRMEEREEQQDSTQIIRPSDQRPIIRPRSGSSTPLSLPLPSLPLSPVSVRSSSPALLHIPSFRSTPARKMSSMDLQRLGGEDSEEQGEGFWYWGQQDNNDKDKKSNLDDRKEDQSVESLPTSSSSSLSPPILPLPSDLPLVIPDLPSEPSSRATLSSPHTSFRNGSTGWNNSNKNRHTPPWRTYTQKGVLGVDTFLLPPPSCPHLPPRRSGGPIISGMAGSGSGQLSARSKPPSRTNSAYNINTQEEGRRQEIHQGISPSSKPHITVDPPYSIRYDGQNDTTQATEQHMDSRQEQQEHDRIQQQIQLDQIGQQVGLGLPRTMSQLELGSDVTTMP